MNNSTRKALIHSLNTKSVIKQNVHDLTLQVFKDLKEVLKKIVPDLNSHLDSDNKNIKLSFNETGKYIAQLSLAGDNLTFYMHSNTFEFDREHKIWKLDYVKNGEFNSYCGVINIYNFLQDSFRYNRVNDAGYLVARIFVNHDRHFFVEGKRQQGTGVNRFGTSLLDEKKLNSIVEAAMLYVTQFDLLVPPYDDVKIISLGEMNDEILKSKMRTGKRLGFQFNSDDIS